MAESLDDLEQQLATAEGARRVVVLNRLAEHLFRVDPPRALGFAREAHRIALAIDEPRLVADSLQTISKTLETLSDYQEAMAAAREGLAIYRKLGDDRQSANLLKVTGITALAMGDHPAALDALKEALEVFLEALAIDEQAGDEPHAATLRVNIGTLYYYLGQNDAAYDYYTRALATFRKEANRYAIALTLGNVSSIHRDRQELALSLSLLDEAAEIYREMGERRHEAGILVKIGIAHDLLGNRKMAGTHFRRAASISRKLGSQVIHVEAQLRLGLLLSKHGDFPRAIQELRKGLEITDRATFLLDECELREALADALAAVGEESAAFAELKRSYELRRKLHAEERQRAMVEMQARFDVESAERRQELFRLRNEHLEEIMEQRSKELTSMAMHLVRKNAFLQKISQQLTIPASNGEEASIRRTILQAIEENLRGDHDWERFEQEFERIHQGFIQSLSRQYPRLTPAELKICALLKINLSNKEITDLLSISLRNVESHRYSIRKKLGLGSDVNLGAYMAGV